MTKCTRLVSVLLGYSCLVTALVPTAPQVSLGQQKGGNSQSHNSLDGPRQVLLRVAVTDDKGRLIANLKRDAFTVYDGGVPQTITQFADDDVPASVAFLIDISGSMRYDSFPSITKDSILRFIQQGRKENEYLILTYATQPSLVIDWTRDIVLIEEALKGFAQIVPRGGTAVYDACDLALEKVRLRSNPKHAMILITDGEDNESRHRFSTLRESLKRSDTIVYAVYTGGEVDLLADAGARFLSDILSYTGGTGFPVGNKAQLNEAFDFFARELRHQYVIGYTPSKVDSLWHSVKVEVHATDIAGLPKSKKPPKLSARTRRGYYGSEIQR